MKVEPVILEGKFVRLEPLRVDHLPAICEVGMDQSLWKWTNNIVETEADLERYVREAMTAQMLGTAVPFVTIERESGTIVGSTRFMNIDTDHKKAEIGSTWINPKWQRTAINSEAKLLMMTHAFEVWGCVRVELKTDSNNEKSKNAMRRIGCSEEGTLRNHMITEAGRHRHSVYFSVIESEWESAKAILASKIRD